MVVPVLLNQGDSSEERNPSREVREAACGEDGGDFGGDEDSRDTMGCSLIDSEFANRDTDHDVTNSTIDPITRTTTTTMAI